jgi:hypothetical protein
VAVRVRFPKSHNIGKAVDKLMGNERDVVGVLDAGKTSKGLIEGEKLKLHTGTHQVSMK